MFRPINLLHIILQFCRLALFVMAFSTSSLHKAAERGDVAAVRAALARGEDINQHDWFGSLDNVCVILGLEWSEFFDCQCVCEYTSCHIPHANLYHFRYLLLFSYSIMQNEG